MSVEMKDSGIDWIGEIPKHWEVAVLKRLLQINNGADYKAIESDSGIPVIGSGGQFAWAKEYMYDGEVVLLGRKGTIDRPLYYNGKFWAVDTMFYSIPTDRSIGKFAYYMSICLPFRLYSTSTALPSMTQTILGNMNVVFPQKEEQSRIANFLDKKCAEIDELIALQEQMIDQLTTYKQAVITETVTKGLDPKVKMKDSGVEWIGEIPEHWDVKRIKNVCSCFGRIGFRGYTNDDMVQEGEGAITLSPSNMKNMTMDYSKCSYLSWNKYYESPEIQIQVGDVLLVKTGSTFGKSSYVHEIPMECTINPQIICFKDHKESAKFLNYLLNTPMAKGQVDTTVVGGTIPTIAQSKIINYSFAFPPLSEQQSIANYLDQKCKEIDELISVKKEKIEKLKAYKKSVIYEYVTGKKQVN